MSDSTYNGWTNYATWRVNLEIFDGFDPYDYFEDANGEFDLSELADNLKQWADDFVIGESKGLAEDYARAFLSEVNWHEIARNMAKDYAK